MKNENSLKEYLSGGVFVELDYGVIKLTTENGHNTICLEPETYIALLRFVEKQAEDAIDLGKDFIPCQEKKGGAADGTDR